MAKTKELLSDGVNNNILNIITPAGIEFQKSSLILGENYSKCLIVTKYPTNPDYGWVSMVTQIAGVTSSVEFKPTDSSALIERCNEQIKAYRGELTVVKEESIRQSKEDAIQDIKNMIRKVNKDSEMVGYCNIILLVQAPSEKMLDERIKKVQGIIQSLGGTTRNLLFKQKEGLKCVSPYGIPNERIEDIGARNMPISTFAGGFPNACSGLNDGIGFHLGKTENGKPIILDTWKRGGDRTNCNWFISGLPGVGKSATVKFIMENEYALGAKIILLDPEREFVDLVLNLGGKVINCGGGKGGRINPLQVRPVPKIDSDDELDELYKDEGKGMSDLALHFQTIRTFHRIYRKGITELEIDRLEEILEKTYERFNIVWDTDISTLKPTDFPIYSDLYEDILKEYAKNPSDKIMKNLKAYFRSIAVGADSFVFNGHTDIEVDTDIIDLDISNLLDGDENILRAQFHNINSWVWQQISADRTQRIVYILDEGYLIVDPENPQALIFVKNASKRMRKYEGSLIFITHSVVDVLDPAVKRHGQALIDNACFKFIMGTDGKNLEETKKLFHLTEAEDAFLLTKQRGKGLLFAGSIRLGARIEIPEKFLALMGKAGGR